MRSGKNGCGRLRLHAVILTGGAPQPACASAVRGVPCVKLDNCLPM